MNYSLYILILMQILHSQELAALDIRRQAVEAAVEAALVHADRQYELLEEQVEQLTAALGHTARQKADAEARIRIHEQVSLSSHSPPYYLPPTLQRSKSSLLCICGT